MDFEKYLQTSALRIERVITYILEDWNKEVGRISSKLVPLTLEFVKSCEGGKRLRGMLVRLGYEMVAGRVNSEILKVSAAFEIFQTAILAHDDIIDLSPTRRGKPTLYRRLGGDRYAISQTICLGDIGFFLAAKAIAESNFPDELKNRAFMEFSQMVINTGVGEMFDVELPHLEEDRQEKDVLTIHRLKTAYYTIIHPLLMGAILAGADQKILENIHRFGESLGIAFQIQDDILGLFGDEKTLGKSVTSDIEEGKSTLLIVEALKKANPRQRKILDKYYGNNQIDTVGLQEVRRVIIDTGALEYSKKQAEILVDQARSVIKSMNIVANKKLLLNQMADFLVKREK